ncbi:MAG: ABC transporter ATP-binding protein [Deltaproteobacteria bacterium]|nr:MAG: ABC transporter ATP-binding protein [Deltaproteobacteria bacterium]
MVLRSEVPGGDGAPPGAPHGVQHLRRAGHRAGLDEDHPPPLPPPPPHRSRRARARAAGGRVIEARQLAKRFGGRAAIEDVSLGVARGEVVGFLGPNGAGKTTTLRILAGVFPPTRGQALIDGHDVVRAPLAARRRLGYAPERPALHLEMTVAGLLDFAAGMKDVGGARARRTAVEDALARAVLGEVAARRIGALSKGVRQRLGLALALVGDPPALLLDEPTAGLDPEQSADMRRLIRGLGTERAVLVSSHALAEVEALCDRVVILHRGRVLSADTPARLAARLRPASRVDVEAAAPADALAAALAAVPGVRCVDLVTQANGHARCRVELEPGRDARAELAARVIGSGWGLLALAPVEVSLEEAFLALVAAEGEERSQG